MRRRASSADRAAIILVTVLCTAALTPLEAQQATSPAQSAGAGVATASSASAALAGPRLRPALPRFEPSLSDSRTSRPAVLAASSSGSHTITYTTLALVLAVIIIVLLV